MEPLSPTDVVKLINALVGVANGLNVGSDTELIRETERRSGFRKRSIELVIGLCAIYWGRAILEDLEFEFSDMLNIVLSDEQQTQRIRLGSWNTYQAVRENTRQITSDWLDHFAKTYSTEYAEVLNRMPIIGEIDLNDPVIRVD